MIKHIITNCIPLSLSLSLSLSPWQWKLQTAFLHHKSKLPSPISLFLLSRSLHANKKCPFLIPLSALPICNLQGILSLQRMKLSPMHEEPELYRLASFIPHQVIFSDFSLLSHLSSRVKHLVCFVRASLGFVRVSIPQISAEALPL